MFVSRLDKSLSFASQTGRSMIEMIGVLAIIGVLSIGGIAGYSKAMNKFRVNKTADQITQLAQNIRTLYIGQRKYNDLTYSVIKRSHLAPEEMYDGPSLINPFGGTVEVWTNGKKSTSDGRAFGITLHSVPQEACIELLTQDWGSGTASGLIALGAACQSTQDALAGCTNNSSTTRCSKAGLMGVDQAVEICSDETNNNIMWKFY